MAHPHAVGPAEDSQPFSSLSHAGSVIDLALCDFEPTRQHSIALRCDGACTLTVTMATGKSRVISFAAGETRALQVRKITSYTGSPFPLEVMV